MNPVRLELSVIITPLVSNFIPFLLVKRMTYPLLVGETVDVDSGCVSAPQCLECSGGQANSGSRILSPRSPASAESRLLCHRS